MTSLNELAGRGPAPASCKSPTVAQASCLEHIASCFASVPTQEELAVPPDEALTGLLRSCRLYAADRSDIQSYNKSRVAWPQVGARPMLLTAQLPPADSGRLRDWRTHLRCTPSQAAENLAQLGTVRPYIDPALRASPARSADFVEELSRRGLVGFEPAEAGAPPCLGFFFVAKKNGDQRLVFDTRVLNTEFVSPISTHLPSAASFAAVEVPEGETACLASADISNAFYNMMLPEDLARVFKLPPVNPDLCFAARRALPHLAVGQYAQPFLRVLPMGWNWALHCCQQLVDKCMVDLIGTDRVLRDRDPGRRLAPRRCCRGGGHACAVAGATYVDNVAILSCDPQAANDTLEQLTAALRAAGLTVHEIEPARNAATFIGLELRDNCVSIKPERLWRLLAATRCLLRRGRCSGPALEHLLGHFTWHLMTQRPALAVLDACYRHVRAFSDDGRSFGAGGPKGVAPYRVHPSSSQS